MSAAANQPIHSFHRAPDESSSVSYLGHQVAILAKGQDDGGRFTLMSGETVKGTEPPPHVHEWEHEWYYVLDGEMEAHCGSEVYRVRTGEFVFLPQGIPHVFTCVTPSIRLLVQAQASGEHDVSSDRFLLELADPSNSAADTNQMMSIAIENGVRFLSPAEIADALPHYRTAD